MTTLPKAALHLHLVGGMRPATLAALADEQGIALPVPLLRSGPQPVALDRGRPGGWFRFQRLYDAARSVLVGAPQIRRVVTEIAEDERRDGAVWVELQVDPSGYAGRLGGLHATMEVLLDAVAQATRAVGIGMGLVVAANRTRHPQDAAALARLAVAYRSSGVVGFGLSNDESRGPAQLFSSAFRIARRGGLLCVPHGGEFAGPDSVRACLDVLRADRIGHGVRACEDQALLDRLAREQVTLEVCPASNVALGVVRRCTELPLAQLLGAGVPVALGSDDPLLFGAGLADQYRLVREELGADDAALAHLAACSLRASAAPQPIRVAGVEAVDRWLQGAGGAAHAGGAAGPAASGRAPGTARGVD